MPWRHSARTWESRVLVRLYKHVQAQMHYIPIYNSNDSDSDICLVVVLSYLFPESSEIAHELGGRTHRYLGSLAYTLRHVAIGSARKRLEAPGGAHTVPVAA